MTACGVASIAICRDELQRHRVLTQDLDGRADRAVWDGLAWLGSHFEVPRNPESIETFPDNDYYWLYALERAGILAGVERMGGHDWYGEGAEFLLGAQQPTGEWLEDVKNVNPEGREAVSRHRAVVSTCFALLFLKRGTRPLGAVTRSASDAPFDISAAATLEGPLFEEFIDQVVERCRRTGDATPTPLAERLAALGPRVVEPLIRRLSASGEDTRRTAFRLLAAATGLDHGYDPAAARDQREAAADRWVSWWLGCRERLEFDKEALRIVERPDPD